MAHVVRVSFPHPTREERVPGTAPGDPKRILHPKYVLVQYVPTKAKALTNCVAPNREGKGWVGAQAEEAAHSPKGNPIRRAV